MRGEDFNRQFFLFHVDVGQVYIWPEPIRKKNADKIDLPAGFDSVMVQIEDLSF